MIKWAGDRDAAVADVERIVGRFLTGERTLRQLAPEDPLSQPAGPPERACGYYRFDFQVKGRPLAQVGPLTSGLILSTFDHEQWRADFLDERHRNEVQWLLSGALVEAWRCQRSYLALSEIQAALQHASGRVYDVGYLHRQLEVMERQRWLTVIRAGATRKGERRQANEYDPRWPDDHPRQKDDL